jgi:transcriptional regulator with XRE-family HTH domain
MKSGREQLQDWMDRRFGGVHGQQTQAADLLGIDRTYLSQLLAGKRQPGLTTAVSIERLTGIAIEAWLPQADGGTAERDGQLPANSIGGNE